MIGVFGAGWVSSFRRRGMIELGLTGLLGIIVGVNAFVSNLVAAVALATAIGATASFLGVIMISWLRTHIASDARADNELRNVLGRRP